MVKSADEIAAIKNSVRLNSQALDQALSHFKPSMTEIDLAAEIEYRMRRWARTAPPSTRSSPQASAPPCRTPILWPGVSRRSTRRSTIID